MIGKTISHYRIVKAEDLKLHRSVALEFVRCDAVSSPASCSSATTTGTLWRSRKARASRQVLT